MSNLFDYQSDRHCAKTAATASACPTSLITSQIDTVPKQIRKHSPNVNCLITSQIDTVPKQFVCTHIA